MATKDIDIAKLAEYYWNAPVRKYDSDLVDLSDPEIRTADSALEIITNFFKALPSLDEETRKKYVDLELENAKN